MSPLPRLIVLLLGAVLALSTAPALAASGDAAAPVAANGNSEPAPPPSVTGTLVSRAPLELVLRDAGGSEHRFRLNEYTRYVWGEEQNPKDLVPGATIRTEYQVLGSAPVATHIWLVAPRT